MAPKDVLVLILEPMNVTLCDKRDLADGITLRLLRWQDDPGLPSGPGNHRVLIRGVQESQREDQKQREGVM